jgi:trehalose 6-phosphate phosphatase
MPTSSQSLPAPPSGLLDGAVGLFLDFDGTLVDLAERHDSVVVAERVPALLKALSHRLEGRLAIVSGRPAHEILSYLDQPAHAPCFAVAGSHGLELIRTDGRRDAPEPPGGLAGAIAALQAFAKNWPGVVIEEKPFGVALHYRQAQEAAEAGARLAKDIAASSGLSLQHGKMVYELRAIGADKGDAVRLLLEDPGMAGSRPVFLGDDLTDEAGFAVANVLGGAGILIGERDGPTSARYGLPDVSAVHGWLGNFAGVSA